MFMLKFLERNAGIITGVVCGAILAPLFVELTIAPETLDLTRILSTAVAGGFAGGWLVAT